MSVHTIGWQEPAHSGTQPCTRLRLSPPPAGRMESHSESVQVPGGPRQYAVELAVARRRLKVTFPMAQPASASVVPSSVGAS